jgi:diguanylate cyclase (GGDEF)-like protein/PAS domain S-box-containing protein
MFAGALNQALSQTDRQGVGVDGRRTADDRYRRALADVPDVILVLDANSTIIDASPEVTTYLGYPRSEIIGLSAPSFLHPNDVDRCANALLQEMVDPSWRSPAMLIRVRHAEGHFRDIELLGHNRFHDPEIGGLLVSLRDVSGPGLGDRVIAADDYLYRTFETVASDGICIFDADGNRAYISPSICQVLGYTQEELTAIDNGGLVVAEDLPMWKHTVAEALRTPGVPRRVECRMMHGERGPMWIETTVLNLLSDPAVRGVVTHFRDIDARRLAEIELHRQARLDPLTQLGNRTALMEVLSTPSVGTRSLLFADLDNFKQVNDRLGHAQGDRVLQAVGSAIIAAARLDHFVARNGGDEFCVVADGLDEAGADELANNVRQGVLEAVSSLGVGISVGVAHAQHSGPDGDVHLMAIADQHMYGQKYALENPDDEPLLERRARVREHLSAPL